MIVTVALLPAALLPALALMVYIYRLDKIEKEPWTLLLRVFILGAVSLFPVYWVEVAMEYPLKYVAVEGTFSYILWDNFIGIALVEEVFKYLGVRIGVWKKPEFDHQFDGIVYAVFSALGFAAIENVFYVVSNGLRTAIVRAVTSVPGHAINGITMGYFLGLAKKAENQGNKKKKVMFICLAILVPTLEHGIYDTALNVDSALVEIAWFYFVIGLEVWAFIFTRKASKNDLRIAKVNVPAEEVVLAPTNETATPIQTNEAVCATTEETAPAPTNEAVCVPTEETVPTPTNEVVFAATEEIAENVHFEDKQ